MDSKSSNQNNSEFYKVYDKTGKYLYNIDINKEKSLTNQYLHGVTCFVVNNNNEVLMEVRANTELTPGKIDLVSGHVNGNEIGIHAMLRELEEEVGITHVLGNDIKRVSDLSKPLGFESKGKIRNFHIDFYCLQTKKHHFTIQPEEVESLKWVPMEEAFNMIKNGQTKFPKQCGYVSYEKIFQNVREFCRSRDLQENYIDK
ncbi:MAG: NUDIX hydrolase [Clostridia bacterium]|nr:NUDIX hydrolase [Clostridia bacterium]